MAAAEVMLPVPDPVLPGSSPDSTPGPSPVHAKRVGRNAATQVPEKPWRGSQPKPGSDTDSNYHSSDSPGRSRTSKDDSGTQTPTSRDSQPPSTTPSMDNLAQSDPHQSKQAATDDLERERAEMQRATEKVSLVVMLPSLALLLISPWFLLPIFTVPSASTPIFVMLLVVGAPLAGIVLAIGCLVGNIVWYHDAEVNKLRWTFHCGKRFRDHFFGEELFHKYKQKIRATQEV